MRICHHFVMITTILTTNLMVRMVINDKKFHFQKKREGNLVTSIFIPPRYTALDKYNIMVNTQLII
jgi:hypothetical protein